MMRRGLIVGCVITAVVLLSVTAEAKQWETDFKKASSQAKASGKYMLLDFSGSDWCGWCIRLDKEVFRKSHFRKFAKANLVCVLVDFPRRKSQMRKIKKQNAELARKYGIRGYPTVVILSPEAELAGSTGYRKGGPKEYVKHLREIINQHKAKQGKKAT